MSDFFDIPFFENEQKTINWNCDKYFNKYCWVLVIVLIFNVAFTLMSYTIDIGCGVGPTLE